MKEINCNLCGKNDTQPLFKLRDLYIRKNDPTEFFLVRCNRCGLVYLNPQPTYQELQPFYQGGYFQSFENQVQKRGKLYKFLRSVRRELLPRLVPKFYKLGVMENRAGKFLDIGCATGTKDAQFIKDFPNWEFYGVEPDEVAFKEASKIDRFKVKKGFVEDARYPDKFFDVVFMHHVLEHVPNPKSTLLECRRVLKDNGKLIITIPNYGSLSSKIFGKCWRHLDIPRHLFHFTNKTVNQLLENTGFRIERLDYEIADGSFLNSLLNCIHIDSSKFDNNLIIIIMRFSGRPLGKLIEKFKLAEALNILANKKI